MAKVTKWVYFFGGAKAEGKSDQRELLGGKGAGLAEMTRIGLPVPGGFTITTDACATVHQKRGKWPADLEKQIRTMLARLERLCGKKLGAAKDPLLVSVRSGAAASMPGMMETILNLGLNDVSVEGLATVSSNRRFAFDAYRRFIMMHGSTAKGIDRQLFDAAFDQLKESRTRCRLMSGPGEEVSDTDVSADELEELVRQFKDIYQTQCCEAFPQDPFEQLRDAINAVFESWMADKAVTYRRVEHISGLSGTAVNVCQMVFGNMGDDCGTGVCFTRDPSTGEAAFYGDMLINAQGEDVVAGVRTPTALSNLTDIMPDVYDQLEAVRVMLEVHYKDMQDLEFTIERNKLYMLQCRTGKRSPTAAFKIAVDQATKGLMTKSQANRLTKKGYLTKRYASLATKPIISKDQAIGRIGARDVERLFLPVIDPAVPAQQLDDVRLGKGIGAVPGAARGEVVFSAEQAEARASEHNPVILVRKETSPEDVGGMYAASGVLTATGGKTSHAAVVARGWGKCCIVGCGDLRLDYNAGTMTLGGVEMREGDSITLDGNSGSIYRGMIDLDRPVAPREYDTIMNWCDRRRRMRVRANADTPADAKKAIELGAEGIGLCRTEHMFFDPNEKDRILTMRRMILADSDEARRNALDQLLPYQRKDFEGVFAAMDGKPVTIRLLDPPLHEFLPAEDDEEALLEIAGGPEGDLAIDDAESGGVATIARSTAKTLTDLRHRVEQLRETNPMLGHRGCRLCITYPEILDMQVRAIMEAAVSCKKRGIKVHPEIMIPLSIDAIELGILIDRTHRIIAEVLSESDVKVKCMTGTMIETPRAALVADQMAEVSEFFSFGTNDMTQLTMALSRDDAGRFLPEYVDESKAGIFEHDPFQSIDVDGVGMLLYLAVQEGRTARPNLKLGICGEHGGDPDSIRFCESIGLDYVSCSPYRIPVARLAAAQATIESELQDKQTKRRKGATASPKALKSKRAEPRASARANTSGPRTKAAKKTTTRAGKKTPKTRSERAAPTRAKSAKTTRAAKGTKKRKR